MQQQHRCAVRASGRQYAAIDGGQAKSPGTSTPLKRATALVSSAMMVTAAVSFRRAAQRGTVRRAVWLCVRYRGLSISHQSVTMVSAHKAHQEFKKRKDHVIARGSSGTGAHMEVQVCVGCAHWTATSPLLSAGMRHVHGTCHTSIVWPCDVLLTAPCEMLH